MIYIEPFDETHIRLRFDDLGLERDFSTRHTFYANGYKYHPKVKAKIWDGKIRLYNERTGLFYKGLLTDVFRFAKENSTKINIDPSLNPYSGVKREELDQFISSLNVSDSKGNAMELRSYQADGVWKSIETHRNLLVAATSAGKSLMIYCKARWHIQRGDRVLLVVPTTMLVNQIYSDFTEYSQLNGWDVESEVQMLYSGKEKLFTKNMMISTWQSLLAIKKKEPKLFNAITQQVDVLITDEAHSYGAPEVIKIIESFKYTKWRTGTTGTLDGIKVNETTLRGILGDVHKIVSARELIDHGHATEVDIKIHLLKYPEHIRDAYKGMKYPEEVKFLITHAWRNQYIAELARGCKGTTLVLFDFVEKHGSVLYDLIKEEGRSVYFIHGEVSNDERERIRKSVESEQDCIIVATAKLLSTGVNIPSIENIIFAVPSKASISIRQRIGRGIRLRKGKQVLTVHDIADDLSSGSYMNTTLRHLQERVAIYDKEQFEHSLKKVTVPD